MPTPLSKLNPREFVNIDNSAAHRHTQAPNHRFFLKALTFIATTFFDDATTSDACVRIVIQWLEEKGFIRGVAQLQEMAVA